MSFESLSFEFLSDMSVRSYLSEPCCCPDESAASSEVGRREESGESGESGESCPGGRREEGGTGLVVLAGLTAQSWHVGIISPSLIINHLFVTILFQ